MTDYQRQSPQTRVQTTPSTQSTANPMFDLRRQVDQLFDEFADAFGVPAFGFGMPAYDAPRTGGADVRVEVSETAEGFDIAAEVPGMSEDDLDIDLSNDVLTVKRGEDGRSGGYGPELPRLGAPLRPLPAQLPPAGYG